MRIMTSNIWGDYFGNPVEDREDLLYDVFMRYQPDVLGFQEVTKNWYGSRLFERLSGEYAFVGMEVYSDSMRVDSTNGNSANGNGVKNNGVNNNYVNGNYVPLAYKKDYVLLAKGYERLRETIDKSKAITWAVLKHPEEEKVFAVCNTHFWWKSGPEHDLVRAENARQLVSVMKFLRERFDCPVFAFGDMNTVLSSEVFKVYAESGIRHLYDLAEKKKDVSSHHGDPQPDENGRLHGKTTAKGREYSIDHMIGMGDGMKVQEYRVVEDQDALDATDHSPVFVDVEML